VGSSGCDLVAINESKKKLYVVEIKCGRINKRDAEKAVNQLKECVDYYRSITNLDIVCILLRGNKKRMESYAREYLRRAKPKPLIKDCTEDLSKL